jgi:hypothetical protein
MGEILHQLLDGLSHYKPRISSTVWDEFEARDHNGCTALMFAVANGNEVQLPWWRHRGTLG